MYPGYKSHTYMYMYIHTYIHVHVLAWKLLYWSLTGMCNGTTSLVPRPHHAREERVWGHWRAFLGRAHHHMTARAPIQTYANNHMIAELAEPRISANVPRPFPPFGVGVWGRDYGTTCMYTIHVTWMKYIQNKQATEQRNVLCKHGLKYRFWRKHTCTSYIGVTGMCMYDGNSE